MKRPQRRRWGWYAALSPGSYKFHGGDGTNLVEKLNSRSIKVLFNTGKGKLGNTDVPLKGVRTRAGIRMCGTAGQGSRFQWLPLFQPRVSFHDE